MAGQQDGIRHRKRAANSSDKVVEEPSRDGDGATEHGDKQGAKVHPQGSQHAPEIEANSYWLTRVIFLRSIAFIYRKCLWDVWGGGGGCNLALYLFFFRNFCTPPQ